ncbi:hypothetical protein HZF05_17830 [Sphingomonas sp. CGMCC 1.13654]|uniref:Uncharacterized protein n=1 Tax=Sphingomonas chungangi TaxID=2683589 RepID=A0A838L919_9SPHN|nr:hypothetical protein [Sphingomonas chungangi]MBA2935943.1 hypothetical protein [Sphingomonas chungangi]
MADNASRYPANDDARPITLIREAHDGDTHHALEANPSDPEAMADIANDESFPASDPPSHSAPNQREAAVSSGYDEDVERLRTEGHVQTSAHDETTTHVAETDASGGTKLGTMRYVLGASLVIVIAALALLLILNR